MCFFPAPELSILEELFGENNVNVVLKYRENMYNESEHGPSVTLNNIFIKITPQATVVSNSTHVELMLLYNTQYNMSSFVSLCELTGPSTTDELFYGK